MLKSAYSKERPDLASLARSLGRNNHNISRKARSLGLDVRYQRKRNPETILNDSIIRGGLSVADRDWFIKNHQLYKNCELARRLGRTERYIEKQLKRHGLDKHGKRWKDWGDPHPRGMLGHHHNEKIKAASSERSRKMWADPNSYVNSREYRQILSDRAVMLHKTSVFKNRYSNGKQGKRADLDNRYFRSSWEANYARYLNWMIGRGEIRGWLYESETFDFPIKRGTRSYTPDFKVTENDGSICYHEVKGWLTQKGATAMRRFRKYYPDKKLIVIDKVAYTAISKFSRLFPFWEGK